MEQRNLIMAVVASITILLGWQFLYEQPRLEKEMAAREAAQQQAGKNNLPTSQNQQPSQTKKGPTVPAPGPQSARPSVPGSGALIPAAPVVGIPVKPEGPSRYSII